MARVAAHGPWSARCVTIVITCTLALTLTPAPHLAAQPTSDPGITALTFDIELDSRFLPLSVTVTPEDAEFTAHLNWRGGVTINAGAAIAEFWPPPSSGPLTPGSYEDAVSYDTDSATAPGLLILGPPQGGCSYDQPLTGRFDVLEAVYDGNVVERFAATYQLRCTGAAGAVFGEVRFNSTIGFRAASADPIGSNLAPGKTLDVAVSNIGSETVELGSASLTGQRARDFVVLQDQCSERSLHVDASCGIRIRFSPSSGGERKRMARLHLPDDTARGARDVQLIGEKLTSTLSLSSSTSKVLFGRSVQLTAYLGAHQKATNKTVKIYRIGPEGTKRLVASKRVGPQGRASVSVSPTSLTRFVADWAGDERFVGATSRPVTVKVQPRIEARMVGGYATSGGYRLYHYTARCVQQGRGCPTATAKASPSHTGRCVAVRMDYRRGDHWRVAGSIRCLKLDDQSRVTVFLPYADARIRAFFLRWRFTFKEDADHAPNTSRWLLFRVTS
jgi:hypothetical protein